METNEIKLRDNIRFMTYDPHDQVVWSGTVTSFCDYDTAMRVTDVTTIYGNITNEFVRQGMSPMGDIEKLTYLIMTVNEGDDTSVRRAFALDFIDPRTLHLNDTMAYTDIRIYNMPTEVVNEVINTITSMGYSAKRLINS